MDINLFKMYASITALALILIQCTSTQEVIVTLFDTQPCGHTIGVELYSVNNPYDDQDDDQDYQHNYHHLMKIMIIITLSLVLLVSLL